MAGKKGIEMSVNALVAIVIGIVILGVGLTIFYNVIDKGTNIENQIRDQIEQNLKKMANDNNRVVVYPDPARVTDKSAVFGVGIFNAYQELREFSIDMEVIEGESVTIQYLHNSLKIPAKDSKQVLAVIDKEELDVGKQYSIKITIKENDDIYKTAVVQVLRS